MVTNMIKRRTERIATQIQLFQSGVGEAPIQGKVSDLIVIQVE